MIQLPRRSVTRFFIPLIDVLTLLFCIFLLMPLIKSSGENQEAGARKSAESEQNALTGLAAQEQSKATDPAELENLRLARQELEQLRKEKIETLQQRLFIHVLEIDADTGKLYYQQGDQQVEIASQDEALQLIARHRQEAGIRELYYLFLYPRRLTGFPEEGQIRRYESWFKGVAHGMDNPRAGR
jgi:hypothetical protein